MALSGVLWTFGHGLSYASFSYSNLVIGSADDVTASASASTSTSPPAIHANGTLVVTAAVKNTGTDLFK